MTAPIYTPEQEQLWVDVARSPLVLTENALDRSKGRDHGALYVYSYGDAKDLEQLMTARRLTRSELDLHFAALLAEYATRDGDLIAEVMGESPHVRPKWKEMRGPRTWLAQTIERALRDAPDHTTAPVVEAAAAQSAPVKRSLADFLSDPAALKPPPAVITRTAWAGRVTLIASPEGWGKSTFVKAGCAAVTTGQAFLGAVGGPPGTVLWARVEESEYDLMVNAHRFGADPERFVAWTPGADPLAELTAEIRAQAWTVVVVDSIHEFALRCGVTDLDDGAQGAPVF